jgi:putative nucleotidyltransferase with HDIG domain
MGSTNIKLMITRDRAIELLEQYIENPRMHNHCYASEAVMRSLAIRFDEDEDRWGLAGLLHDLDVEVTKGDPKMHGLKTAEILASEEVDDEFIKTITMHNEMATGKERTSRFEHALSAAETITGLIVATTLVYPDKKLASVKPKSVVKRMKEKHFAASVDRDKIRECEKIGIPLPEFAELSVKAMQSISDKIGL